MLTGTRGGANRAQLLRAIDERPRNANQLAEDLNLQLLQRSSGPRVGARRRPFAHQMDEVLDVASQFIVSD